MKNRKNPSALLAILSLMMVSLSSCNRGYGCPYDFSVGSAIENAINLVGTLIFGLF